MLLNLSLLKKLNSSFSSFNAAVQWNILESSWQEIEDIGVSNHSTKIVIFLYVSAQYLEQAAMVVNIEEIFSHLDLKLAIEIDVFDLIQGQLFCVSWQELLTPGLGSWPCV